MLAAIALFFVAQTPAKGHVAEFFGESVGLRVVMTPIGKTGIADVAEEYYAKDAKGKWRMVLTSPTSSRVKLTSSVPQPTALRQSAGRLFIEPPGFAFQQTILFSRKEGSTFTLKRAEGERVIQKIVEVPAIGKVIKVSLRAHMAKPRENIEYFVDSLAFAPDGKTLSQGGKPDSTFSPGLRKGDNQVVGDHFFRAPVISAQRGTIAALMMPDVNVLAENRPIPTILDLDAKNDVVDATLMSYGFADHRGVGHVWYAHDASMVRRVPQDLKLAYRLILDAKAEPFGAYRQAVKHQWEWYGHETFEKILPQAMPFEEYAKVCYPAAINGGRLKEINGVQTVDPARNYPTEPGWFEVEIDGQICGGIPAGWGYQQGWVSWQSWFNQLRSAWGLHWWGLKLKNQDWIDKSNKMLNLALAAPMDRGLCPTTYQIKEKAWLGSLIRPRADCYYDLTNIAWKGIWMLRWLDFEDCPRREDILKQCQEIAGAMVRLQNADGSIPTWLTKDQKVVPILDHSAQTALPAWFLAEILLSKHVPSPNPVAGASGAARASDFLVKNVVDQQRWYDFETFFSCSPKQCLQMNGVIDDPAMHDTHTLSPPQNTLCMQWAAVALMKTSMLLGQESLGVPLGVRELARAFPGPSAESKEIRGKPSQSASKLAHSQTPAQSEIRNPKSAIYKAAALKALDIMALYQNAWNMNYRKTAYTFGGFGVQNSDGEYNDARQAQFGCTLADFGAALGRRDYFERGVAATRAAMTLINHPLHHELGIYPNPNYPLGLQPENCCHGGSDHQSGRTGFDWGEGSGLASMAWLLDKFGPVYKTKDWTVIVDGGFEGAKYVVKPKPLTDPTFDFEDWRMEGWLIEGSFPEVPTWSERLDFGVKRGEGFIGTCEDGKGNYDDAYTGSITSPEFSVTKSRIRLLVGGGSLEGTYVELIDASGKRLFVERGRNTERMDERVWDVSALKGQKLRIRAVDRETGGWGHINLGRVRCGD
ncbi:MAG: hypothetical protein HZC36_15390 [Armatimonadetes bacterium]|nr:hypothetical protein [Armatimonadota bacterium]